MKNQKKKMYERIWYLDSSEFFWVKLNELMFKFIIKPITTFGKGIEETIENGLRQNIKVPFKKFVSLEFIIHSNQKVDVIFGDPGL